MEEGNVTNNLFRDLFPDTKEGCKIDCEGSFRAIFCYKWYQERDVFLSQWNIYDGAF